MYVRRVMLNFTTCTNLSWIYQCF